LSLGAIKEIQQKNIIFPEFLRLIRQISRGLRLFAYFLVGQKVGPGRENLDFLPAEGGPPEESLQLSMLFFQATA
jgi:hypothetical protein